MPTIRVEQVVDAPRDALFAVLTDHEGYGRFSGVKKCELIRTGRTERNGLGALRRVHLGGPTVLDEEIVRGEALPIRPSDSGVFLGDGSALRRGEFRGEVEPPYLSALGCRTCDASENAAGRGDRTP